MLLTPKTLDAYKQELFQKQNGHCAICGLSFNGPYNKQHLDHDHALTGNQAGRCRGLLCPLCNGTDGQFLHKFNRSGLKTKVEYIQWMESLLVYLKQDSSENPLHPNYPVDMTKMFKRMDKEGMIETMNEYGFEYNESDTKKELTTKFKKQFRKAIK